MGDMFPWLFRTYGKKFHIYFHHFINLLSFYIIQYLTQDFSVTEHYVYLIYLSVINLFS